MSDVDMFISGEATDVLATLRPLQKIKKAEAKAKLRKEVLISCVSRVAWTSKKETNSELI